MKFLATFDPHGLDLQERFDTEEEAQEWLDSYNNNADYMTVIDFLDENGKVTDGYIYTEGAPR